MGEVSEFTGGINPFSHRTQRRPSMTAEAVTMARAIEHLRPSDRRVLDDPFAHLFLSRTGRAALSAWSNSLTGRALRRIDAFGATYVPLRHRFIDDHLLAALDQGATQVVLLGAGYDARAYRFADELDGRPVFEVDLAAISRSKAAVIEAHRDDFGASNVIRVEIDFETQQLGDRLADTGFVSGERTFFIWEGVPMYLTRPAVKATLDAVWAIGGEGSHIAHDMWHLVDDPGLRGTAKRLAPNALSVIGEPVTFFIHPEEADFFLRRHGFTVTDLAMGAELQRRYAVEDRPLIDDSLYVLCASRLDAPATNGV